MPFQGFLCEADAPLQARVTAADCLACARRGALPGCHQTAPVLRGILAGMRSDTGEPRGSSKPGRAAAGPLTVTTLLGCPRKRRLMQTEPYWLRPAQSWWAFRGQLMHGISAAAAGDDPAVIAEVRFSAPVPTPAGHLVISGQPDLVYTDRRHLVDYKTTRSVPGPWRTWTCPDTGQVIRAGAFAVRQKWLECAPCGGRHEAAAVIALSPPRPYARHIEQVSLYRLLLEENGYPVETAEIIYQDMERQVRVPVELLAREAAWALLEARLALFVAPGLPDVVRDPEALWECDFCPVRAACEHRHGGPVGRAGARDDDA